jgi:hypothetical protein
MCLSASIFLLQKLKGSMSGDARDFTNIETRTLIKVVFPQGNAQKKINAFLIETLGEHAPTYATAKNWVARFKLGYFFHMCCASSWKPQNRDYPGDF